MQATARDRDAAVAGDVGVGEVHGQHVVVFLDGGAEEERPVGAEAEQQAGEEAGAVEVEAFLAEADGLDVAVMVEDGEGVALFEDSGLVVGGRRRGDDVKGGFLRRGFVAVVAHHRVLADHRDTSVLWLPGCG